ncbi:MAG: hypothetical protein AB2735_06165, partial [Candidatus Thiodiazotropha taylori]
STLPSTKPNSLTRELTAEQINTQLLPANGHGQYQQPMAALIGFAAAQQNQFDDLLVSSSVTK